MYGWDTLVLLKHYLEPGLSKAPIAHHLGVSCGTRYGWLAAGLLERELPEGLPPRERAAGVRPG